jgi:hypothetical protein
VAPFATPAPAGQAWRVPTPGSARQQEAGL